MFYTSNPILNAGDDSSGLDGTKFYCSLRKIDKRASKTMFPNLIGRIGALSLIAACSSPEETPLGFGGKTNGDGTGDGTTPGGGDGTTPDGGNGDGTTPDGGNGDGTTPDGGNGGGGTIDDADYTVPSLVDVPPNTNGPITPLAGGKTSTLESSTDTIVFSDSQGATKTLAFSENAQDNNKTFTLTHDTTTELNVSSTVSVGMLYDTIDDNTATDLILISSSVNNSSGGQDGVVKIIWDYLDSIPPNIPSYFRMHDDENTSFSEQLIIKGGNNQNLGAISAGDATSPNLAFLNVDELEDPALAINAPRASEGSIYIIWNIGSYNTAGVTTLDLTDDNDGVLRIKGNVNIGKQFENVGFTRVVELDSNDKDDFLILATGAQFGTTPVGALHIVWDVADHQSGTIEVTTTNPADVLSIYGQRPSGEFAETVEILDLDDDGINDIWVTDNREGYILWGSALMDAGQGKNGVINLGDTTTTDSVTSIDVFSGTVGDFTKAGLWFNTANLNYLTTSFWFTDISGDGDIDAAVKKVASGTEHDYWIMTGAENVLATDQFTPVLPDADDTISAADLLSKGIIAGTAQNAKYAKQDVNDDDIDDLIERVADADGNHVGHHKVWLGDASGTFDVTATPEYVEVTSATPLAASEDVFADQTTNFQMIDIA